MRKLIIIILLTISACTQPQKKDSVTNKAITVSSTKTMTVPTTIPTKYNREDNEGVYYINNIPIVDSTYEFHTQQFYDAILKSENFYKSDPDIISISKYITQKKYDRQHDETFTELYLYNIYTTNMDRMRDLQKAHKYIMDTDGSLIKFDNSFGIIGAIPLFITNAANSKTFFKEFAELIIDNDFIISSSVIDSILSYWISQQDMASFIQWMEFFDSRFDLKSIAKFNQERIIKLYGEWATPNFIKAALTYPPAREYLYQNSYINTPREQLYSYLIRIANSTYRRGDEGISLIKDLIIAYPESVNLLDKNGLSLLYNHKDNEQFVAFLKEQGLAIPDNAIEYQNKINKLINTLYNARDGYPIEYWRNLITPITNINTARYKGIDYDQQNSSVFDAVFARNDISSVVNSEYIKILLEQGLQVQDSFDLLDKLLNRNDSTLDEYLSILPLPKYTEVKYLGMHASIDIKKYLTNEPYDYYITTALHEGRKEDIRVLLKRGYINDKNKEKYLQYAIDKELQTALVLGDTNDLRLQRIIAKSNIYEAIYSDDYDQFVKIAESYDINSHYGIIDTIFTAYYDESTSITSNKINMLRYLDKNGYDFGLTNQYGSTQFGGVFNDQGPSGWGSKTLLRDYVLAKLPLPDNLLKAELSVFNDEKEFEAPNSMLLHLFARNNEEELLNSIKEQGYIDFNAPYAAQELLRSIQIGADKSVQFFIDNGVSLASTNKKGENAIDIAWQLPFSNESYTYYNGDSIGSYNKTKNIILQDYKAEFLEALPSYSNVFYYELAPNEEYPNGIQNIQYNLAKKDPNITVFHPLNFTKKQYELFNQNIDADTPSELLFFYGSCTAEYKSNSSELFYFVMTNGADINRIIPNSYENLLMYAGKASNISNFVFLLNQENIDLSYTNELGNNFLHDLAQNYSEDMGSESSYYIIDRISVIPIDKINVNATNNLGYTFYWLLNSRRMFSWHENLEKVLEILKIDTNIGKTTDPGGVAIG